MLHVPVLLRPGHTLFVHGAVQLAVTGEDDLIVDDDSFDDLVDMRLTQHGVLAVWDGHQRGAEADRQIVRVHHVLIAVLGQTEGQDRNMQLESYKYLMFNYS